MHVGHHHISWLQASPFCSPSYVSMVLQEAVRQAQGAAGQWGACTSADGVPEVGFTLRISCTAHGFAAGSLTTTPLLALIPRLPTTSGQPHVSGLYSNDVYTFFVWTRMHQQQSTITQKWDT